MEIAYFFISPVETTLPYLEKVLNDLEDGTNAIKVIALCFFDENAQYLKKQDCLYERLSRISEQYHIALLRSVNRHPSYITEDYNPHAATYPQKPTDDAFILIKNGFQVALFPDFYTALADHHEIKIISF